MFCQECGQQNGENNFKCTRCGVELHDPLPAHNAVPSDGTMGGMIPYKNAQALAAYYCGVFSLIPVLGLPLGIVAFVLGILGLGYARMHPEARGQAHAWVGIIVGGLSATAHILLIAAALAA